MKKSLIICIAIVVLIIIGDIISQNFTENKFSVMDRKLEEIGINRENKDVDMKLIDDLLGLWDDSYRVMAYYLEHNELEKARNQISVIKAAIEIEDTDTIYEEVCRARYIVAHIKEKQTLKLYNIF